MNERNRAAQCQILDAFYGADVTEDWLFRHMHAAADSIIHDKLGPCLVFNAESACLVLASKTLNELFISVPQSRHRTNGEVPRRSRRGRPHRPFYLHVPSKAGVCTDILHCKGHSAEFLGRKNHDVVCKSNPDAFTMTTQTGL